MIEACLIHNESDPSISPEIRDDAGFNSWIERIAKKNHEKNAGYIYTIETWFGEYKKQQEKIQVISDLLRAEAVSLSLFKDFKNPEQIILAKQKMLEKLEWDLIVNTQAAEKKISNILEVKQRVEQNEAHVAKLEKEKTEIVRSLQNKEVKISGELVFNILHGQNAELVKIHDFERFLIDMAQNYEFYHGPLKEKEDMGDMRRMFVLHDKTRKGTYDGNHIKKIGLWGRLTGKLARYRKTGTENYDDLKAFETTIRALEAAEVIPTHTSNKDLAKHNMDNLILLVKKAEDAIANHIPLEDFLHSQGGTEKDRESFLALYNTYIKNKGRNSSMQKLARESDQQGTVVSSINTHLEQAQQRNEELRQEAFETIRGDAGEFDEFAEDVKNEFILDEMNSIIQTLRENKKGDNIEKLNLIAKKLESIQTTGLSDDITLTHRRASLELSQAYIRIVSKKPEGVLAPNNMAYYKKIFESSEQEIPKAKKKEYVVAILQTLKDVLPKKTKTLEKLEIERFIKHFEAIEKTLA
jgi:hypothetical protein